MSCSPDSAIPGVQAPPPGGELALSSRFACHVLHAIVPVRCCLVRQATIRRQRTKDTWRGQGTIFPSCDGCTQGAAIRAAVGVLVTWRGRGPGGRFDRGRDPARRGIAAQRAARARLRVVGLLDIVPCLDEPPPGEPDEGEAAALATP